MAKHICFVGPDNYPVLSGTTSTDYIGGESVQQTLLAKAFKALGNDVTMIVRSSGNERREIIDGINVLRSYNGSEGFPVVRFAHPRLTSLFRALKSTNADIYYQSCAGMLTGATARYCRQNHKQFVFRVAHDTDCIPGKHLIRYWRDRKLYEYGLRRATLIAAQSHPQVDLLKGNYGLDSVLVSMVTEIPKQLPQGPRDIDVLWVNNLRAFKRPERVLDLAERLPSVNFTMIGGPCPGEESYYEKIRGRAGTIGNLRFLGPVPYAAVNQFFERSKVFINTSESEGFPNSFLQAWVRGVPVISFVDPGGIIAERNLGTAAADMVDMSAAIAHLVADDEHRQEAGRRGRSYVTETFAPQRVAEHYLCLLEARENAPGG